MCLLQMYTHSKFVLLHAGITLHTIVGDFFENIGSEELSYPNRRGTTQPFYQDQAYPVGTTTKMLGKEG